jgi:surfeit locus 1 family protein
VLRLGRYAFAPRVVPTLAAAAFIALTGWLSHWQAGRAAEKDGRQALYEARMAEPPLEIAGPVASAEPILFRRVHASGKWIEGKQAFVDNQVHEGVAGFEVVTPLELAGGAVVLVNRGWVARSAAYPSPPKVPVPPGRAQVTGLATLPPRRFVELSPQAIAGNVFQNLTLERYRNWSGIDVLPVMILADPTDPGLVAVSERPNAGADQNREYEATWFLLAATAAVLWLALNLKRTA